MHFTSEDEKRLENLISGIETRTGVQVLAAVVGKSDAYPEAPWKAFALASAVSALGLTIQALLDPPWITPSHAAVLALVVLGAGAAAALLTTLLPPFGRWFTSAARREAEVDQYARSLFLEREMFRTRHRAAVLLLVSLFERTIVILPDSGVAARVAPPQLNDVVARMTPYLSRGARFQALAEGIAALQDLLLAAGFSGGAAAGPDEIGDELIQRKGTEE